MNTKLRCFHYTVIRSYRLINEYLYCFDLLYGTRVNFISSEKNTCLVVFELLRKLISNFLHRKFNCVFCVIDSFCYLNINGQVTPIILLYWNYIRIKLWSTLGPFFNNVTKWIWYIQLIQKTLNSQKELSQNLT